MNKKSVVIIIALLVIVTALLLWRCSPKVAQPVHVAPFHEIVHHQYYTLAYSEEHEQAAWVRYTLLPQRKYGVAKRSDRFIADPKVSTGSATNADYANSGYDRGHLAPAADMSFSDEAMSASFYYSNMSPQVPQFNRGVWKKLEEKVRSLLPLFDSIVIVTGPIFKNNLGQIGENEVTVPGYYYKTLLATKKGKFYGIGFILPNAKSTSPLSVFVVPIDSVEAFSNLDFYAELPDDIENAVEASVCYPCFKLDTTSVKHQ